MTKLDDGYIEDKSKSSPITLTISQKRDEYFNNISWDIKNNILGVGDKLSKAKVELGKGLYELLLGDLGFNTDKARIFIKLHKNAWIQANKKSIPVTYKSCDIIINHKVSDEKRDAGVKWGIIHPKMKQAEATRFVAYLGKEDDLDLDDSLNLAKFIQEPDATFDAVIEFNLLNKDSTQEDVDNINNAIRRAITKKSKQDDEAREAELAKLTDKDEGKPDDPTEEPTEEPTVEPDLDTWTVTYTGTLKIQLKIQAVDKNDAEKKFNSLEPNECWFYDHPIHESELSHVS